MTQEPCSTCSLLGEALSAWERWVERPSTCMPDKQQASRLGPLLIALGNADGQRHLLQMRPAAQGSPLVADRKRWQDAEWVHAASAYARRHLLLAHSAATGHDSAGQPRDQPQDLGDPRAA